METPHEPQPDATPEDRAAYELLEKLAASYEAAEKTWHKIQEGWRNPWKL